MDDTFYAALGVESDADDDAIRRAYRERVKERHPDVSDEPGDPRAFKRLTTARDVLVDEDERARYDRLGHRTYVRRHLRGDNWSPPADGSTTDATTTSAATTGATTRATQERASERTQRRRHTATGNSGTGPSATGDWQQASEAYRYTPTGVPMNDTTFGDRVRGGLLSVGPWLLVHAVFLVAAAGIAWFAYARTAAVTSMSLPAVAFGALLFGLAAFLSTLHVVSLVYA